MRTQNTKSLGKYYTSHHISKLLVDNFSTKKAKCVLELGVGDGALISEAAKRWTGATYFTADIEAEKTSWDFAIKNHQHLKLDALSVDISEQLGLSKKKADISICNPPYVRTEWKRTFEYILEDAGLSGTVPSIKDTTADVLFLAQNLRLLKSGGELGIIVPEGVITGERLECVRSELLNCHTISSVIQLPTNVFKKTEAQTYILSLTKNLRASNEIPLYSANCDGTLCKGITIPADQAAKRMDFKYYKSKIKRKRSKPISSKSIKGSEIVRGGITWSEARKMNIPCFHTTQYKSIVDKSCYKVEKKLRSHKHTKFRTAKAGDILFARVGRSLCEQVLCIAEGEMVISDCIYRLRVPSQKRKRIWSFIVSESGKKWLRKQEKGVCAKYISKSDILNMPV